jgi:hypothetical protein
MGAAAAVERLLAGQEVFGLNLLLDFQCHAMTHKHGNRLVFRGWRKGAGTG